MSHSRHRQQPPPTAAIFGLPLRLTLTTISFLTCLAGLSASHPPPLCPGKWSPGSRALHFSANCESFSPTMWRRTLQPQALNLVRVLPIDNAAWVSARVSAIPKLVSSSRYWLELRDDVLMLYPALQLLAQHHMLLASPPPHYPYPLAHLSSPHALESLPIDHIFNLAELVPSSHIVHFVLSSARVTCRQQSKSIIIRSTNLILIRPVAHIICDSTSTVQQWREDFNQAIFRDRKRLSDFCVLRHIGKGASGRVYEIEDKTSSERLALKVIEKNTVFESKDTYRHAMDERLVLQIIRHHPYILDMHYAFQNAKRLFLVTEYCPGGDLFEYMNRRVAPLDEQTARFISAQVLLALSHLHALGIVYRDLKLENILIDDEGNVRLADFGLTKVLRQHDGSLARTNTFCGTREYVAPEMLRGESYDTSLDFWTFGILLYEMVSGRTPFYTSDHAEIYRRIEKSPVFYPRHLSSDIRGLLSKLLVRDPAKRLGSTVKGGVAAIKKHSWFKSIDWNGMMDRDSVESPLKKSIAFQQRKHENFKNSSSPAALHGKKNGTGSNSGMVPIKRRKSRKELKQEKALANVLADVDADLRFASSSRVDKEIPSKNGSTFSGSVLGIGRSRTALGRTTSNLVLVGYSFSNKNRNEITEDHPYEAARFGRYHTQPGHDSSVSGFGLRSASAMCANSCRWLMDGENDPPGMELEDDEDEADADDIDEEAKARTLGCDVFVGRRSKQNVYNYDDDGDRDPDRNEDFEMVDAMDSFIDYPPISWPGTSSKFLIDDNDDRAPAISCAPAMRRSGGPRNLSEASYNDDETLSVVQVDTTGRSLIQLNGDLSQAIQTTLLNSESETEKNVIVDGTKPVMEAKTKYLIETEVKSSVEDFPEIILQCAEDDDEEDYDDDFVDVEEIDDKRMVELGVVPEPQFVARVMSAVDLKRVESDSPTCIRTPVDSISNSAKSAFGS